MPEWGGSRGDVDIQVMVLMGVEFFISVGLSVVGCGSVICRSQLTWNVCRPSIFYCLLGGSVVFEVEQFIYL
jgi:hypothetical protein